MRGKRWIMMIAVLAIWPAAVQCEDMTGRVKKAVERSTLDQPGTKPFHLKAVLTPSFERDKDSGRTGDVEIWWASPNQWKREVRSPEFHQIEIVDGSHDWQKSDGNYYPQWLREAAVELIRPVPLDQILEPLKKAEVRRLKDQINIDWTTTTGTAEVRNIQRWGVALRESSGELLYANGFGWGGEFKDYSDFHGRMVARTVNVGTPQVTAKVTTLEDLGTVAAGFFDATAKGGDPFPLKTQLVDEITLRKNLLPMEPPSWPPLPDGPLEGNVTTEVVIDREGSVRELGAIVSENSAVNDAGHKSLLALKFKPFLLDNVPVQAMSQITIPFKTVRPAGMETFESAHTYFDRGKQIGFPAAGAKPYVLRAEFDAMSSDGKVEKGQYEDTWMSPTQWRREVSFAKSHCVRSRNGEKRYQLAEGPDAGLLQLVMRITEPIPAADTFVESDWRIKRDVVNHVKTIRVLAGYESPEGKLDAQQARGYWFDDTWFAAENLLSWESKPSGRISKNSAQSKSPIT